MATIREAAVAGRFYPGQPRKLAAAVDAHLAEGETRLATGSPPGRPRAVIAPHAGYPYSGPIAGSAFAALRRPAAPIERAVIIGPSHHVGFAGIAVPSATAFATPLGTVEVDREALATALEFPFVRELDRAHEREHALEVELPFLLAVAPGLRIVPLVIGEATIAQTADLLAALQGGPETVIVVSSDLSHYLPYPAAREIDGETAGLIIDLDPQPLTGSRACGYQAVRGLLQLARDHGLSATTLDLRNSGDTAGSRDQVVGYGAFAFFESPANPA